MVHCRKTHYHFKDVNLVINVFRNGQKEKGKWFKRSNNFFRRRERQLRIAPECLPLSKRKCMMHMLLMRSSLQVSNPYLIHHFFSVTIMILEVHTIFVFYLRVVKRAVSIFIFILFYALPWGGWAVSIAHLANIRVYFRLRVFCPASVNSCLYRFMLVIILCIADSLPQAKLRRQKKSFSLWRGSLAVSWMARRKTPPSIGDA
jgi:hypothetical protein